MTLWLLTIALALNTADAAITCRQLQHGEHELNPLMGQSCARVIGVKTAFFGVIPLLPSRAKPWHLGTLAVSGGIGVGVSVKF